MRVTGVAARGCVGAVGRGAEATGTGFGAACGVRIMPMTLGADAGAASGARAGVDGARRSESG